MKKALIITLILVFSLIFVASACSSTTTSVPTTVTVTSTAAPSTSTATVTTTAAPTSTTPGAQTAEEFYKQNGITLVVNGSVGGGTDYAGRAFASYWSEVTGGPAMIVQVKDAGGGIEGLNYVHTAKNDGLTIGITTFASDIATPKLMGLPGITWDARELEWIGMFGDTPHGIMIPPDSTWKTAADLQAVPKLRWVTTNPGSSVGPSAVFGLEMLGLQNNSQVTWGFQTVEQGLAMQRGEADIYAASGQNGLDDISKGFSKWFCMLSSERSAWGGPDTPAITELVTLTPDQQDMLAYVEALGSGKVFYAPPGTDPAKMAYLQDAFDEVMLNKGFLKIIKVRFPVWETPTNAQGVSDLLTKILGWPPEKLAVMSDTINKWVK